MGLILHVSVIDEKAVGLADFIKHLHAGRQRGNAAPTEQKFGVGMALVKSLVQRLNG